MKYKYKPKTKEELIEAIKKEIYEVQGTPDNPNWQADLNCIDTSLITDMSYLFSKKYGLNWFNGNINRWNISNVENMVYMFYNSEFDKSINNWNVSNVTNMYKMFNGSKFNQDISNWNVSNVKEMTYIFYESKFNKDIGNWPQYLKKITGLNNISIFNKYSILPDEIKYPQTIANIFDYVIENSDSKKITKNQAVNILTEWFNNKQKEYVEKKFDKKIVKQLLINDFLDILKNINNKEKFLNLLKENRIDIDFSKEM